MKRLFFLAVMVISSFTVNTVQAQEMPPLPVDKDVRQGKLDNGLTYYIRKNGWPEQRVNFYIAQRVGSIQEEEDQRGLAHFLEHMAFNGSENFPGDRVVEYTRSLGVGFGGDLNAYTSIDQTVYRICNVPSTNINAVDSCMLILKDWSNGLLLEGDEIDKERGVIHEEWRLRTSATQKMLERNLERFYPNNKYGRRMPIGTMEVIDNFKYEALRDYYHKWYRPDNQAIIVVGDIDVDRTEAKIKEMFGTIPGPAADAAQVVDLPVEDNEEPIIIVDKHKEMTSNLTEVMFKTDPFPTEMKQTMMYPMIQFMINAMGNMMNVRLDERAKEPGCPYLGAQMGYGNYMLSKTKDAFELYVAYDEGKSEAAVQAAMEEVVRAIKFGFTGSEFERAKEEIMSQMEKAYENRNKTDNHNFGVACYENYLEQEPLLSIEDEYQLMKQITPMLNVQAVNQLASQILDPSLKNLVSFTFLVEKDGLTYPTEESMLNAIKAAFSAELEAYVDNVKNEPLMTKLPKPGTIKKEAPENKLGYKEWTLSNGVKVLLKHTDHNESQILMRAVSKGGNSLYENDRMAETQLCSSTVAVSGLGEFDNTQLQKALAGKQVGVSFNLGTLEEQVDGSTTPKDIETMFQLMYLTFTDIRKDEKAYSNLMSQLEMALRNKDLNPMASFNDTLKMAMNSNNPRAKSIELADLEKVSYDSMLKMARERMADAKDFTFIFTGNFNEDTLKKYVCQYVATLPVTKAKAENWQNRSTPTQGEKIVHYKKKMDTPKSQLRVQFYDNKQKFSLENAIKAQLAGAVLDMILLKSVREDAGAAYSTSAVGGSALVSAVPNTYLAAVAPVKPDMAQMAIDIIKQAVKDMAKSVDAEKLTKAKLNMLKDHEQELKENDYWHNQMDDLAMTGVDCHNGYEAIVEAQTPETIAKFVAELFGDCNMVEVLLLPEE